MLLEVGGKHSNLIGTEDKGGQAGEEDRYTIEAFYMHSSCWVGTVTACKTSWEEGEHSFPMGRDSSKDGGPVAIDTPENPNVFCRVCEGDVVAIDVDG